ncbi:DUF4908 domain-containing protein [Maricaulis sp. CAU 1757]
MMRFLILILATVLLAPTVDAQSNPLRDRLLRNERPTETSGWYQRADTGEFFVFDRSGEMALLRERDGQTGEVLVLYANRAPGGGTAFITDTEREVLRLTPLGGMTYFPIDSPDGVIVDFASPAGMLTPAPRSPDEVRLQAERLASMLAQRLDRNVSVEYAPAPRAGLGLQYDTLRMAALALDQLPADRRRLGELGSVHLLTGERPTVYRDGPALVIVIAPQFGFAGRPSSAFIAEVLMADPG